MNTDEPKATGQASPDGAGAQSEPGVPRNLHETIWRAREGALYAIERIKRLSIAAKDDPGSLLSVVPDFVFRVHFRNAIHPFWSWAIDELEPMLTRARSQGPWKANGTWVNAHAGADDLPRRIFYALDKNLTDLCYKIADALPEPSELRTDDRFWQVRLAISPLAIFCRSMNSLASQIQMMKARVAQEWKWIFRRSMNCLSSQIQLTKAGVAKESNWQEISKRLLSGELMTPKMEQFRQICEEVLEDMKDNAAFHQLRAAEVGGRIVAAQEWDWPEIARRLLNELDGFDPKAWEAEIRWESAQALAAASVDDTEEEGNSICLMGEVWRLRYGRENKEYPKKGNQSIAWLARLLAAPNRCVAVADLRGDPEGKLAGDAALRGERETDLEGVKAIKKRLQEIEDIAAVTGGCESQEQERADLLLQLQAADAEKKTLNPLKNAHHNIATQLRNLRDKLATDMPNLAAHLKNALKFDFPEFGYYPPAGSPTWKI